jgi:hypothetical protein
MMSCTSIGELLLPGICGGQCRLSDCSCGNPGKEYAMKAMVWACTCGVACALLLTGCSTAPESTEKRA